MKNFKDVTDNYMKERGDSRFVRTVSEHCWISVSHRTTGFGHQEWETAICFSECPKGRTNGWTQQHDCKIIKGDRRKELKNMPENQLCDWYDNNIEENRNSMESILDTIKEKIS